MSSQEYPPKALLWLAGATWLTAIVGVIGICVWYGPSTLVDLPTEMAGTTTSQYPMMPQITPFQQMLLEHRPEGSLPFTAVTLGGPRGETFVYLDEEPIQLLPLTELSQVKAGDGVCISRPGCEWLCFVYKTENGWDVVRRSIGATEHPPVILVSSQLTHKKLAALLKNSVR